MTELVKFEGIISKPQNQTQNVAWRIVDANANRAMEGLRSLEDYARLAREDEWATSQLKAFRHELATALSKLNRAQRLRARSTENDAGTGISSEAEKQRSGSQDVVPAACERVSQALRQLEEFSKPLSVDVAAELKQLRYQAYDLLAQVELRLCFARPFPGSAQLYLLIDGHKPAAESSLEELHTYVGALAEAGVDVFQLRDKQADGAQLVQYSRAIQDAIQNKDALFIVNDRVDIALAVEADGVHVGQEDLSLRDTRNIVGDRMWVGVSTHSVEQALAAEQGGADYIGCGPTFPSQTKQFDAFPGVDLAKSIARECQLPTFAIGGVDLQNVSQVLETGISRVAVSHVIHGAGSVAAAVDAARELKSKLETYACQGSEA